MKKIALFSDGTSNSSSSPRKSNVWRAYQALDLSQGSKQVAFYDNGVGTSAFTPTAILGLAFGWGLARNVRQIYGFLCRTYEAGDEHEPADEIYAFGFSRGAFTMRVVVALIASEGIIDRNLAKDDRDLKRLVAAAYHRFRRENFTPSLMSFFLRPVRDLISSSWSLIRRRRLYDPTRNIWHTDGPNDQPLIKFVGVWDTVDAYGLPIDELTRAWDKVIWPLTAKDRELSPRIGRACHALALDEQRESFEPMLWNEDGEKPGANLDDERLSQLWFPGVHSNIGGGYPDDSLAFVALDWMVSQSEKNSGLMYLADARRRIEDQARINGPIYDSRSGVSNVYRYAPRNIERLCQEKKPGLANWLKGKFKRPSAHENEVTIVKPKIHHSVFDHLTRGGDAYAPMNLPEDYAVVDANGNVFDIQCSSQTPQRETAQEARGRRVRQSFAWNKVWARKLLYLITLVAIIFFIVYPYSADPGDEFGDRIRPWIGTLSAPIQAIPALVGKIPGLGIAESWAEEYKAFPFQFITGILIIVALLIWTWNINAALKSEMRLNWHHATRTGGMPAPTVGWVRRTLARFLEGAIYRKITTRSRIGLETIAVLFLLLLLTAVFSRLYVAGSDGVGGVCEPAQHVEEPDFGKPFYFDPKNPCFDTGLKLQESRTYWIDFEILASKNSDISTDDYDLGICTDSGFEADAFRGFDWRDASIEADVNGWCSGWCKDAAPWYMSLFTPFRRHLFADWYQPIARIDSKLFDRYPLHQVGAESANGDCPQHMIQEFPITARRTGQLYLYLNDAVVFIPGRILDFYTNNEGHALVTVYKSNPNETSDRSPVVREDANAGEVDSERD